MHYIRVLRHGDPLANHSPPQGGRPFRKGKYLVVYLPDHPLAMSGGRVLLHRKVAWDAGLLTNRRDHVHHIHEDTLDNRLENLEVLTPSEHSKRHNRPRRKDVLGHDWRDVATD